ncbi:hypothetical protein LINPERHAP1_LOCUS18650 [Linum perenne]
MDAFKREWRRFAGTDLLWKPHRPPPSRFENNLIKKAFNAIHKFRAKIELDPFRSKCAKRLDFNMRVVAANLNGSNLFIRSAPLRSHAGDPFSAVLAMKIHGIDELSAQLSQPAIQARVFRLWEAVNINDSKLLHLDMILIDAKNNDIWVQIPSDLAKIFKSKLEEQKIYIMAKFKVMRAIGGYRPVENKFIIQFTSSTTVQEVPELESIPNYKFSFANESYVYSNIGQSQQLKGVTLWGPLAIEMDRMFDAAGDRIITLIVCSVIVKIHGGASKLYPDLDIPEVQPLKAIYSTQKYPAISENIERDKVFMVQCIVTGVDYGWSYNGCTNDVCLKKVEIVMENYTCDYCNHEMIKTVARYRVMMDVYDSTGTSKFVLMDKEGVKFFGIKAEDLLSSLNRVDTDEPPTVLMNIVGKNLTFVIKLTSYTLNRGRNGNTVSQILDGASNLEEKFDKVQKDDLSSSQSLSSCVVQNERLTEATPAASHSAIVLDEKEHTTDDGVAFELSDDSTIEEVNLTLKKRKRASVATDEV